LTPEETNKGPHSKDDATFALLTTMSLHTVTMFNKINNLPRLDVILSGEPIGLGNCVSKQHGNNIGESNKKKIM
jgi:hypothetical protein